MVTSVEFEERFEKRPRRAMRKLMSRFTPTSWTRTWRNLRGRGQRSQRGVELGANYWI